jgi:dipeptidyl aminopeptidase/acylaminoacyl peptidase
MPPVPPRPLLVLPLLCAGVLLACSRQPFARSVAGSPNDGLVFARTVGGQTDLWRARLSDGATRPFLATADRDETWPYWSEAAHALVFQSEPAPHGAASLWLWRPADADPTPLGHEAGRDERWLEWSPDGRRVVFAWRRSDAAGLSWIELPSGREVPVASSGPRDLFFRPSFAPDSQRIVAQRRDLEGAGSDLWLIDESGPHRLTREPGFFEQKPFFTRTGRTIVFARQAEGRGARQMARVAAEGGPVVPLAAGQAGADEHSARPSPVRDEVAFVSDRSGSRDVWLAPLDGGPARDLTPTPDRDEFAPRWSPDGERLVVTATGPRPPGRDGDRLAGVSTTLVVVDRTGHVLLETPGMMADWMPPF